MVSLLAENNSFSLINNLSALFFLSSCKFLFINYKCIRVIDKTYSINFSLISFEAFPVSLPILKIRWHLKLSLEVLTLVTFDVKWR